MAARNFIILSLGQLTKSDWKKSIHAFTALSVSQSKMPHFIAYPFHFLRTLAVYGWDMTFGNHYINKYKLGQQSTDGFVSFLRSRFGGTDEQLKAAWDAMCEIDDRSLEDIKTAISLGDDFLEIDSKTYDVELVVVSATNLLHFEFIQTKVNEKLQSDGIPQNYSSKFFASITKSYEVHEINQTVLANTALSKLNPIQGTDKIVSFHFGIQPNNCSWKFKFNPKDADLMQVVKSVASSGPLVARA